MNIAFYSGASGMRAFQQDMDLIANNVANVNTVGYKPQRSVFSDLIYTRMAVNSGEFLTGHGVKNYDSDLIFRQGPVLGTNNSLDYAIVGSGFFGVQFPDGEIQYTRNGAFDISMDGNNGYLVTADGAYVMGTNGSRIQLARDATGMFDLEGVIDRLGVYQLPNPFGMEPAAGNRYLETPASGEATLSTAAQRGSFEIVGNALESSSVDLADEMVMVIQTQKAFQFSARLIQTADELEEIVNNLR